MPTRPSTSLSPAQGCYPHALDPGLRFHQRHRHDWLKTLRARIEKNKKASLAAAASAAAHAVTSAEPLLADAVALAPAEPLAVSDGASANCAAELEALRANVRELRAFKASLTVAEPIAFVMAEPLVLTFVAPVVPILAEPFEIAPAPAPGELRKQARRKQARRGTAAAKVKKERSALKLEKKQWMVKLRRLKKSAGADTRALMLLKEADSMGFAALLAANVDDLPPSMLYLRPLLMNQLAVLKSKCKKRCGWHQGVIEAASAAMFLTSRALYVQLKLMSHSDRLLKASTFLKTCSSATNTLA